jgi:3'-phosphoadenosine 5'-phosphosulfate sulfotransferase (PAPS reductase)/FAD synthetase
LLPSEGCRPHKAEVKEPILIIDKAVARVRAAVERFNPKAIVSLFSGGHDSATATLIAHEAGADQTLHVNTGIGVEQTRDYVRDTCAERDWNLQEYRATENTHADGSPDPQIYDEIVKKYGFPGEPQHSLMYSKLKERQLRRFERDIGATTKQPVLYISGARSDESVRRMGNVKPEPQKKGRQVWLNAIHDFSKKDCANCMAHCGLKRNEVVDLIHKSGECLCGAFAKPGELSELEIWFPKEAKRIRDLEQEVVPKFPWNWEDSPPEWYNEKKQGQTFMFRYDEFQPLCHRCNAPR